MPYNDLDLCNQALSNVGVSRSISNINENSKEAAMCRLWLPTIKEQALAEFPWPFADTYATLGQVAVAPNTDWGYSYRYPNDSVRLQRLVSGGRTTQGAPYKVGSDASGLLIYCDQSPAVILYTKRITDPGFYPVDFGQAVAWLLGYNIASPISAAAGKKEECRDGYLAVIEKARAIAYNEAGIDPEPDSIFITGRE
jgi:hypothetical protein